MSALSGATRDELASLRRKLQSLKGDPEFKLDREREQVCDLVFAGGGAKGVAHLGAIWALDILGVRMKRVAGNSAGAITAAFVASGFTPDELVSNLMDIDFRNLRDGNIDKKLPKIALMMAITTSFGMYEGTKLIGWIQSMLERKGAETFGKLPRGDVGMLSSLKEDDGHRLTVIASDVTHAQQLILPNDLSTERYGYRDIAGFRVADAVRMSISVPFFFTPVKLHKSVIVDGAFASNLPLEIFDREDPGTVRWPTLGINLTSDPSPAHPTNNLFNFGLAVFDTMRYGQSNMSFLNYPTRICRIIDVATHEIKTLDFDVRQERKERLFLNGARAVLQTLRGYGGMGLRRTWNFDRYIQLRKRFTFPTDTSIPYFDEECGDPGI